MGKLQSALISARVGAPADVFREIRMIKTKAEISRLRQAHEITEARLEAVWEVAELGIPAERLVGPFSSTITGKGVLPIGPSVSVGKAICSTTTYPLARNLSMETY